MAKGFTPYANGMRNLRNSKMVQDDLLDRAQAIARQAEQTAGIKGAHFAADVQPGENRAHAIAYTANVPAMIDQRKNKSLAKAIDAGR